MKVLLNEDLLSYNGETIMEGTGGDAGPVTVRKALEIACVSADPQKWVTGDQKYEVYAVLKRIGGAKDEIEFDAKETLLLKELIGNIYGPSVVGSVYDLLDPPLDK